MSIKVKMSELKLAAKIASQVRDASAGGKKNYPWLNFYRLVADPNFGLALYATDGSCWLTWVIQTEELFEDTYDIVLSSSRVNDFLAKENDGPPYEIIKEPGQIALSREDGTVRIEEEDPIKYPQTPDGSQSYEEFSVSAGTLTKNFKFAEPFINAGHATAAYTVVTWTKEGILVTGAVRHLVRVEGMPCPPMGVSFKKPLLNSVLSFLNALEGDVNITLSEKCYTFLCPASGRKLIVSGETARFPSAIQELGDKPPTVIKFDGKILRGGVGAVNALLLAEADRFLVRISGSQENSYIHITTLTTETKRSRKKFPIIRETEGDHDIEFVVNGRIFEISLGQMEGAILEGRFYESADPPRFCIEDERSTEDDTYRCVFIPVTMSAMDAEKEEPSESKKKGESKPDKRKVLTRS